jgi:hypothetical protein
MVFCGLRRCGEEERLGTPGCPHFEPAAVVGPFATPFLGPVQPVFLEAERLVRQTA